MLRIYWDAIEGIRLLEPALSQVKLRSRSLADQSERASTSVVLNLSEGAGSAMGIVVCATRRRSGRRAKCGRRAMLSRRLARVGPEIRARLNKIIGTLVNILKR